MKKLLFAVAAVVAVSFASCDGNTNTQAVEETEVTCTDEVCEEAAEEAGETEATEEATEEETPAEEETVEVETEVAE